MGRPPPHIPTESLALSHPTPTHDTLPHTSQVDIIPISITPPFTSLNLPLHQPPTPHDPHNTTSAPYNPHKTSIYSTLSSHHLHLTPHPHQPHRMTPADPTSKPSQCNLHKTPTTTTPTSHIATSIPHPQDIVQLNSLRQKE